MYIVIPESPEESTLENTERVEQLPADVLFRRAARQKIYFDTEIDRVVRSGQQPGAEDAVGRDAHVAPATFDAVVGRLQRAFAPLMDTCQGSLVASLSGDEPAAHIIHNGLVHKMSNARFFRGANVDLHPLLVAVAADTAALDEFEKAALELYLGEYRDNGGLMDYTNRANLEKFTREIQQTQRVFLELAHQADRQFRQVLAPAEGAELPIWARRRLAVRPDAAEAGPWVLRLEPDLARVYLAHCSARDKRWAVWVALQQRAAPRSFGKAQADNQLNITTLRRLRHSLAELLGHENHAERVLARCMAGSVAVAVEQVDAYRLKFREAAAREVAALLALAQEEGFTEARLQCWDLAFWARRAEERHWAPLGGLGLGGAFTPDSVLAGLFQLTETLLGVAVVPTVDGAYEFHEHGRVAGRFRIDHARRETYEPRARAFPLATATATRAAAAHLFINSDAVMPLAQVRALCEAWGDLLQQSLTRVNDMPELSGQSGLAPDARRVCAFAWRRLLTRQPTLLRCLAVSGPAAPTDQALAQMAAWRDPLAATNLMERLYRAAFDLDVWAGAEHWTKAQTELWQEFMPVERHPLDDWPCSAVELFARADGAGTQYADVWAETVAADVAAAFVEQQAAGDEAVLAVGARFRATFLALGSALPPNEVFRRFRGRDCRQVADIL